MDRAPLDNDIGKVLFFGRKNCDGTKKALSLLQTIGFDVVYIESNSKGEPFPENALRWSGDYIFCYRSFFILSKAMIDRASIAAINFHPAPPEYPGSGCLNFALYEDAKTYGVTAHLMNENIDNGQILRVHRFPILESDDVISLLERTHVHLTCLLYDVLSGIANGGSTFISECAAASMHETWNGVARKMKDLDQLQRIEPDITSLELERRIRSAHTRDFPLHLSIHGRKFVLDH